MLTWAAWQWQFSQAAWGTLRNHVTKPFPQPAAPLCIVGFTQGHGFLGEQCDQNANEAVKHETSTYLLFPLVAICYHAAFSKPLPLIPIDGNLLSRSRDDCPIVKALTSCPSINCTLLSYVGGRLHSNPFPFVSRA